MLSMGEIGADILKTPIGNKGNFKKSALQVLKNILIWLVALGLLTPLFWMLSASFKNNDIEVFSYPIKWIPGNPTLHAYEYIFTHTQAVDLPRAFLNSTFVVLVVTIGSFITCVFAAYAFSKIQFRGSNMLFIMVILSLAIPGDVLLVPQFAIFQKIGVINHLSALYIVPVLSNAFGVFMIRQAFVNIPRDLTDSARIDGASHLSIIKNIMVPLSKESIITFLLLQFTWIWNDFQSPLLWISDQKKYTLPIALNMLKSFSDNGTPVVMAGSIITLVPIVIIFIVFQKYFEKSLISAGVKG